MKRLVLLAASVVLVAAGAYLLLRGQSAASIDTAIKSSWASAAPDWQARLVQDETQKLCSQYRNAPPKAVADAILARENATKSLICSTLRNLLAPSRGMFPQGMAACWL